MENGALLRDTRISSVQTTDCSFIMRDPGDEAGERDALRTGEIL
jgi:hypothetical protein